MKIIKEGKEELKDKNNHGWKDKNEKMTKIVKCKTEKNNIPVLGVLEGCGAELEVEEKDLEHLYWHGTHFPHSYAAFKCAYCGKYNNVDGVPDKIWKNLKKKKAKFDGFSEEI